MKRSVSIVIVVLLVAISPVCSMAQKGSGETSVLANGDFSAWKSGQPLGWEITTGAKNPRYVARASKINSIPDGGLALSGDAKTGTWKFVSQTVDVQGDQPYFFSCTGKILNVKREKHQFNNCYVGIFLKDKNGKTHDQRVVTVTSTDGSSITQSFRTLPSTTQIQVGLFLSKSGTLRIGSARLRHVTLAESFDVLVTDMARHYSYIAWKNIDWESLVKKYAEDARQANTSTKLKSVILEMIAELGDLHVWINHREQTFLRPIRTRLKHRPDNFDFAVVNQDLVKPKSFGEFGVVGTTSEGWGYIRITSLHGLKPKAVKSILNAIRGLFSTPGLIVDLRQNRGGSEMLAAQIAGMFTNQNLIYARHKFRSNDRFDEFSKSSTRILAPQSGPKFQASVICLIGPRTVSSGEGFAMMMKSLPQSTTLGQPSRGASGNPAPVHLADGIDVFYSRWVSMMPDGTPIEDRGVPVDELIEHQSGRDATYERALEILSSKQ